MNFFATLAVSAGIAGWFFLVLSGVTRAREEPFVVRANITYSNAMAMATATVLAIGIASFFVAPPALRVLTGCLLVTSALLAATWFFTVSNRRAGSLISLVGMASALLGLLGGMAAGVPLIYG